MESCPFCKKEVSEDLLRFGGTCPHCFIEIPGEEAPTDAGVQPPPPQEPPPRRNPAIAMGVVFVLLVLGATGIYAFQAGDGQASADDSASDEDFFTFSPTEIDVHHETVALPEDVEPSEEDSAGGHQGPSVPDNPLYQTPDRFDGTSTAGLQESGVVASGIANSTSPDQSASLPKFEDVLFQDGAALSDETLIRRMIQDHMWNYSQKIQTCYERGLEENAGLKGRWILTFTIRKSGAIAHISVAGRHSEPELEACMVTTAEQWTFDLLSKDFTIEYPFNFPLR